MSKIVTLGVAAAAYLLGAKAGRERYEQIMVKARRAWSDPRVQEKRHQAADTVKDRAPQVREKVVSVAKQTADKVTPGSNDAPEPKLTA